MNDYNNIISTENLFEAWIEFRKGKRKRPDVQRFERHLEDNLFDLHSKLRNKSYKHGSYQSFYVQDPKQRHIHKASVKDRVVHHLLYNYLYKLFDSTFIYDSYSCRLDKGTHNGIDRLEVFTRKVSKNYTRPCWGLKLDIRKFFASVDHQILLKLLKNKVKDKNIIWLLSEVIESFHTEQGRGMPLGNLTSQVFANIYLNELDQFVKHNLKVRYYIRYADDFIFLSINRIKLVKLINPLEQFLKEKLKLDLHPNKIVVRKLDWGIDFLGYIVLPHYRLPRAKTRRRIFIKLKEKISKDTFEQSFQSYLGYLSHANSYSLTLKLRNQIKLHQLNSKNLSSNI